LSGVGKMILLVHSLSNEHLSCGSSGQVSIINVFFKIKNIHRIKNIKNMFYRKIKDIKYVRNYYVIFEVELWCFIV